jgi:hypothetical protein
MSAATLPRSVERPIRYVRENFVQGREFPNDADLDEQWERWQEKADGRLHGTTRKVPRLRFLREEQPLLRPLAERHHTEPWQSLRGGPASASSPKRKNSRQEKEVTTP